MDLLVQRAQRYFQGDEEGVVLPGLGRLYHTLAKLLKSYPGGLTEAVIITELSKLVDLSKRSGDSKRNNSTRVGHHALQGSLNRTAAVHGALPLEFGFNKENQAPTATTNKANDCVGQAFVPLQRLVKHSHAACLAWPGFAGPPKAPTAPHHPLSTGSSISDTPAALTTVHWVECLMPVGRGPNTGSHVSNTTSVSSVPPHTGGTPMEGVWVCHLGDDTNLGTAVQLYLRTEQHVLIKPQDGRPWLQGMRVRVGYLKLISNSNSVRGVRSVALERNTASTRGAPPSATAMPTPALLPVLSDRQWHELPQHLQQLCEGPIMSVGEMEVEVTKQAWQPGATSLVQAWVVAHVESIEHHMEQNQLVVKLCSIPAPGGAGQQHEPTRQAVPLVAQGQQAMQVARLLRCRDRLAVYGSTVQVQQAGAQGTACSAVLWLTGGSVMVVGENDGEEKRSGAGGVVAAVDGEFERGPEDGEEGIGAWCAVRRVVGCRRRGATGVGTGGGWTQVVQAEVVGRGFWAKKKWDVGVGADVSARQVQGRQEQGWDLGGAGSVESDGPAQLVMVEFACAVDGQVVRSIQEGHCLLLIGLRIARDSATPTAFAPSHGGGCTTSVCPTTGIAGTPPVRLTWDESDPNSLLLNLTALPALLTTPPLYLPLLRPVAPHPGSASVTSVSSQPQPCVALVVLMAVNVHTYRTHKLCRRPVRQSLDLNDLWGDMDMDDDGDEQQQQRPQEKHEEPEREQGVMAAGAGQQAQSGPQSGTVGAHVEGSSAHTQLMPACGAEHPGLWKCDHCAREVAGGEVCWVLGGQGCFTFMDPDAERQRIAAAWTAEPVAGSHSTHVSSEGRQQVSGGANREVVHEVVMENDALCTLCAGSAELWRSLSVQEQCKRLPELVLLGQGGGCEAQSSERPGRPGGHAARAFVASLVCDCEVDQQQTGVAGQSCGVCGQNCMGSKANGTGTDGQQQRSLMRMVQIRQLMD